MLNSYLVSFTHLVVLHKENQREYLLIEIERWFEIKILWFLKKLYPKQSKRYNYARKNKLI